MGTHGHPRYARRSLDCAGSDTQAGGLARRKPSLSFASSVSFLLRFAERTLAGLLFHEPPRTTRCRPSVPTPHKNDAVENGGAQAERIGMARVRHPGVDPLHHFICLNTSRAPAVAQAAKAVAKAAHICFRQPAHAARMQLESEKRRRNAI